MRLSFVGEWFYSIFDDMIFKFIKYGDSEAM